MAFPSQRALEAFKCVTLAVIAVAVTIIAARSRPATLADVIAAPQERRAELIRRLPLIRVHGGTVDIGRIDDQVEIAQPVEVLIVR